MLTAFFVAARIVANPVSNVFQKQLAGRGANPVFIIAATHALLTLACLPPLVAMPAALPAGFWANMVICALLAVSSNVLLVHALRASDLSVLGPVNAYKSVISLVLGIFLIGEVPTRMGAMGVLLVLTGSYFVVGRAAGQPRSSVFAQFFRERGIQFRLAALVLSATEAVFLKRAVLLSSPLTTFAYWCVLGFPIAAAAGAPLMGRSARQECVLFRRHARTYVWLSLATGAMQLTTLLTFNQLQVGYSLALFQLSTLLSVFFGYRYFQEGHIRKRLIGSLIMMAGAVLIVVHGRRF